MPNIEKIVFDLRETGFSINPHFIDAKLVRDLLDDCKDLHSADHFSDAGVGREKNHSFNKEIRRDKIAWLDGSTTPQRTYLEIMDDLRISINQSLFLGLFEYEAHYAVYEPGAFYRKHVDQFKGNRARVVTTVFYLNADWTTQDGGELAIYDPGAPEREVKRILPVGGTLVSFLSETFPHEVLTTHRLRSSIAGWFRIRT